MKTFVSYKRVSTQEQANSGLGLQAQDRLINNYVSANGTLLAEYVDEGISGSNNDRPGLLQAIKQCKRTGSTLVVQKLDRLSRSMAYVVNFLEDKTNPELICADSPQASRLLLHITASIAQEEREKISERTKSALQSLKDQGVKLGRQKGSTGNYKNISETARAKGSAVKRNKAIQRLELWREELTYCVHHRLKYTDMVTYLTEKGMKSARGNKLNTGGIFKDLKMLGLL